MIDYTIATPKNGTESVSGRPVGEFLAIRKRVHAFNKSDVTWSIDHIPSGRRVHLARTLKLAKLVAAELDSIAGPDFRLKGLSAVVASLPRTTGEWLRSVTDADAFETHADYLTRR